MTAMPTTSAASDPAESRPAGLLPPIAAIGFGTAVAMWCVWFITHLPALGLPIEVAGPVLLLVQLVALSAGCARLPQAQALLVGLGSGLLCGVINLAILGTRLAEPIATGTDAGADSPTALRPDAWMIVLGWLGVSAVLGLAGGAIGRAMRGSGSTADRTAREWYGCFAVVAAVSALPLLTLGGLVTSTASGLAVPNWPGTYQSNMFLYPISLMAEPRIYLEHTHRLFGILVGLTTIGLFAFTLAVERRRWVWAAACVLLALVVVQGLLGAYRVTHKSPWLAVAHGALGQAFFCGLCVFTGVVRRSWVQARMGDRTGGAEDAPWPIEPLSRRARTMAILTLAFLALQLVFGAMYRHLHTPHALYAHIAFSVLIVIHAIILASVLVGRAGAAREPARIAPLDRRLALLGKAIFATVALQFVIGWVVLLMVLDLPAEARVVPTSDQLQTTPLIPATTSLVRTLHQANGAVLLACVGLSAAWAVRLAMTRQRRTGHDEHNRRP